MRSFERITCFDLTRLLIMHVTAAKIYVKYVIYDLSINYNVTVHLEKLGI